MGFDQGLFKEYLGFKYQMSFLGFRVLGLGFRVLGLGFGVFIPDELPIWGGFECTVLGDLVSVDAPFLRCRV